MNGPSHITRGLILLAACLAGNLDAAESIIKPAMTGRWEGGARIIVSWCQQTNLAVAVEIQSDGTVTGKIGDATLTEGRFKKNRGWLGRKMNLWTDYIISGRLDGSVVAAEGITRAGVSIPLNFSGAEFTGGVHTTGSHFGGREKMVLSAASLRLVRAKDF